jgi:Mg-chelatase subunit ChlD
MVGKSYRNISLIVLIVIAALALGACSSRTAEDAGATVAPQATGEEPITVPEDVDYGDDASPERNEVAEEAEAAEPAERAASPSAAEVAMDEVGMEGETAALGGGMAGDTASGAAEEYAPLPPESNPQPLPPDRQFGPLQAGKIDDNVEFSAYLQYRTDFHSFVNMPVHDLDISQRHTIRVTTRNGLPVLGATVTIESGQRHIATLRTTATGTAYFFPGAYGDASGQSYTLTVEKGLYRERFTLTTDERDAVWPVTLGAAPTRAPVQVDVLFLLDATGSMGDEIDQLKDNVLSISAQIDALPSRPDVRFGLVHYRDRGDEYVVRRADFTSDTQAFQRELQDVMAGGGGDDPESLNEALHVAINEMDWRSATDTVQLVFLLADAPPHLDYSQDYSYADETLRAAEMGIKIFPIGSRLDGGNAYQQQAEYVLRQIAQFTGGSFIFLTYEDTPRSDGDPGTEYHVPEESYSVEDLDALVVRLVQNELDVLAGTSQDQ